MPGVERERNKPVWPWVTFGLFVLFIGYPLSIGPYLCLSDWLSSRARTSDDFWGTVYSALIVIDPVYDPLRRMMERSQLIDNVGNRYISMWRISKHE